MKGKLPHISSLSHSHTEEPRHPMQKEGLLDRSHSPSGIFQSTQWRGTVRPMHKHFTQLFLWWDLVAWYLRHLLETKHPLYTAQPASRWWLLKPQLWTASQILLRAQKTNKPACFKLVSIMLSVTMSGTPFAKTKNLQHPPHVSLLPQILFLSEETKWKHGYGRTSWPAASNCRGVLICINRKHPAHTHTHIHTHFLKYNHSSANFRHWFLHVNTIQISSNSLNVFFFSFSSL